MSQKYFNGLKTDNPLIFKKGYFPIMEPKGVTRKIEKADKKKELIKCKREECKVYFPKRGAIKKYCSAKCQWTDYNAEHPIERSKKDRLQ